MIKWIRNTKYSQVSECGTMKLSKAFQNGEPKYTLWVDGAVEKMGSIDECKNAAIDVKISRGSR